MLSILNLLVLFTLTASAPAQAPATTTPAATSAANNCYCQTIPLKDWGK